MKHSTIGCIAAAIAIASALFFPLAHAEQFEQFEDDRSYEIFEGTGVHVCSPGSAMSGVDAANNRFLCMTVAGLGAATIDRNTSRDFRFGGANRTVHVCPPGSVMIGWHKGNNWLICAPSTTFQTEPFSDTGSSAPEPLHSDRSMHTCNQDRQHAVMVGIHEGENVLICSSDILPAAPFNLIVAGEDASGFPLNPRWAANLDWKTSSRRFVPDPGYCLSHSFSDPSCLHNGNCSDRRCTTDPIKFNVKDGPGFSGPSNAFCAPENLGGHVNWRVATYTGKLWWDEFSGSRPTDGDADYNFLLQTDLGAGADTGNTNRFDPGAGYGALTLEFASYETIDKFTMPWWKNFKQSVDDNSNSTGLFGLAPCSPATGPWGLARCLPAIATGTLGLDCEYTDCKAELHPIFALAVETNGDLADDTWAFFARNSGNEGSCSSRLETVASSKFAFDVPWKPGAGDVKAKPLFEQFPANAGAHLIVTPLPCEGKVRMQISGVPPSVPLDGAIQWVSDGEVHLTWTPGFPACLVPLKWLSW